MFSNEELKNDLLLTSEKFKKEFNSPAYSITRHYFTKNSKTKKSYEAPYATFKDFKESVFSKEDIKEFDKFNKEKKEKLNELNREKKEKLKELNKEKKEELNEFEKEKKLISLKDENNKLKKEKEEMLRSSIKEDEIIELYKRKVLPIQLPKPVKLYNVAKNVSDKEAVLFLSDFHLGEIVLPEEVNFANEFNSKIMMKRLDRIFHFFLYYCNTFKITKTHIVFLGDLLSGSIHDELAKNCEMTEVDGIFFLQDYITKKLLEIEKYFTSITCEFVVGNHSRLSKKPEYKKAHKMNWEYVMAKQLQQCFCLLQKEKKKIKINVANSLFKIITVAERRFLITHGTFMTGAGGGGFLSLPVYSLAMSSAKLYGTLHQIGMNQSEIFDDIQLGHLHTTAAIGIFNGNTCRINGCIVGTNEFSLHKMKSVAKIEQTMLIVQKGKVNQEITLRGTE